MCKNKNNFWINKENNERNKISAKKKGGLVHVSQDKKSLTTSPLPKRGGVGRLKIYVFSPGRYPFTDNFREVEDKVELVALPAVIYDAYQKVLPKRKEKLFEEEKEQVETEIPADLFEGQGEFKNSVWTD